MGNRMDTSVGQRDGVGIGCYASGAKETPKAATAYLSKMLTSMPKTRRYSIEITDANGKSVWFAAADWTDEERRIAIAQNSRLCGMPDENCFTEAPKKPTKPAKN